MDVVITYSGIVFNYTNAIRCIQSSGKLTLELGKEYGYRTLVFDVEKIERMEVIK